MNRRTRRLYEQYLKRRQKKEIKQKRKEEEKIEKKIEDNQSYPLVLPGTEEFFEVVKEIKYKVK